MKIYLNKILLLFFIIILSLIVIKYEKNNKIYYKNNKLELDYNNKFAIIKRKIKISTRGLMAYYYMNLGCVIEQIYKGFIPILDLATHPNIFNKFSNNSKINPWEIFFEQPFNYSLENVIKKANPKNIIYVYCDSSKLGPHFNIFYNKILRNYWKNIANIYVPIKERFIKEADYKRKYLFNNSNNVLGVLVRGTDYIASKPFGHQKQPKPIRVFKDMIQMDYKNKYDFFFLTTEDDNIRDKFIQKFRNKLKYIKSTIKLNYNYKEKNLLAFNKNIIGNISFMKIYLINIIILSKCLDIIASRTGGSLVALLLSKGFRNSKIYYLGIYK